VAHAAFRVAAAAAHGAPSAASRARAELARWRGDVCEQS